MVIFLSDSLNCSFVASCTISISNPSIPLSFSIATVFVPFPMTQDGAKGTLYPHSGHMVSLQ